MPNLILAAGLGQVHRLSTWVQVQVGYIKNVQVQVQGFTKCTWVHLQMYKCIIGYNGHAVMAQCLVFAARSTERFKNTPPPLFLIMKVSLLTLNRMTNVLRKKDSFH